MRERLCRGHLGEFVSASPELLVETRARWIHVEPMKGTAPPSERHWLLDSDKDRAERSYAVAVRAKGGD
jgi:anthranilate/para-aminobenzoate synthase component I